MNKGMNLPAISKIMMDFEKESAMMDMKEEMMSDAVEDAMEDDLEDEEEEGDNTLADEAGVEPVEGDSESKFQQMLAMFEGSSTHGRKGKSAAKGKGTQRGSQSIARPRKVVEIGPSGLPYTPLELQVRNPS